MEPIGLRPPHFLWVLLCQMPTSLQGICRDLLELHRPTEGQLGVGLWITQVGLWMSGLGRRGTSGVSEHGRGLVWRDQRPLVTLIS